MSTADLRRGFAGPTTRPLLVRRLTVCSSLLALALFAPAASAQEVSTPRVSFDGFGTVGVAYSTDEAADFVENPLRAEGAGFSSRFGSNLDSRLAGQLTVEAFPRLTGVLQVVVEQGPMGEYEPAVEWANLSYAFTPDLSLRGGRIVMPLFLVSEARKVSYANPWIRPPVELYAMVPIYSWDGVDATYRRRLGEWTGTLNTAVGRASSEMRDGNVEAERFWIANAALQRAELTGRVAFVTGDVTVEAYAPLFEGFRAFGPAGEEIASRYDVDDTRLNFATAGLEYDRGPWFSMAELGWLQSESAMGERLGGYASAGLRLGAVSPFATWSRVGLLSEPSTEGLSLTGLPAEYAQMAAGLNAGLNTILRQAPVQQTFALGGRWDVVPGVALKAQAEFIERLEDSDGTFINHQPTFEPGGNTQLFSVAATFVF